MTTLRRITLLVLALALLGAHPCSAASAPFKPGNWRITTKCTMSGMPMQMPAMTHTQCLTADDMVPQPQQMGDAAGNACAISNLRTSGNTVTYDLRCNTGDASMTGHGTITYTAESMQGTMTMTMQPENMKMTYTYSGPRVGDCP